MVWGDDAPIATVTHGEWGDEFPGFKFEDGHGNECSPDYLGAHAVPTMKKLAYGSIQSETAEANARRIVACVNACEGIPTADLESGAVQRLVEALEALVSVIPPSLMPFIGGDVEDASAALAPFKGGE